GCGYAPGARRFRRARERGKPLQQWPRILMDMTSSGQEAAPAGRSIGLRERKKLRTRRTIERVALQLFEEQGFHATTLAQIAEAAEVAPSTLHAYFPSKEDILFATFDAARESAKQRLSGRSPDESVVMALQAWLLEDMP